MKKIRIIITMILIVCVGIFTINVFNSKDNKVIKEYLENTLAIMISNENGIGYKDYEKSTWPSKEYKFKEAKCFDINGEAVENVVTFNEETRKATITTNQTVSCTLYFDKPIITYLRKNDPNGVLSQEEVGGMYRYQGVGVEEAVDETHKYVDNNYICFGTNDASKCNCNTEENCDKYMYRIIGINEDDELYLIKMKGVEDGDTQRFEWNSKYLSEDCPDDKCDWPNADLYKRLNGNGSQVNMSNIFINNERYDYLKEENLWYEIIMYHDWLYGHIGGIVNADGLGIYKIETGQMSTTHYEYIDNEWQKVPYYWGEDKKVNAKIGIMYLHDYYLAYDNITKWYRRYDTSNWILFINNHDTSNYIRDWFLTSIGNNSYGTFHQTFVYNDGHIDGTEPTNKHIVRPTFYLTNTIQLSGAGTIDNPYIIDANQ